MHNKYRFSASVSVILFNDRGDFLFVSPNGINGWEAVGGWIENESIIECISREITEELGCIDVTVYDILDAHVFVESDVPPFISIWALAKYNHGDLLTGSDILNFHARWFSRDQVRKLNINRPKQFEIIEKAIFLTNIYLNNNNLNFLRYKWNDYENA